MSGQLLRALAALAALSLPVIAHAQSSPSDFTSATRYDLANHVVGTIAPDPDGTGPLHYAAVRNTYDVAGRLIRIEKGELASWQSESVAPSAWTGFTVFSQVDTTYDALDRKLTETVSSGGTAYSLTQYSYDTVGRLDCTAIRMNPAAFGSLPSSACTLGTPGSNGPDRITKNVYDDAGQLLKIVKAYGQTAAAGLEPLQQDYATYTYTANGKQATVKDADGNVAGYSYDGLDRLKQWNFPDKVSTGAVSTTDYEAYTYDANGNRLTLRKRDGSVIGYAYDALNRVTVKDIPGGTASDVYYGYDAHGAQLFARFGSATGAGLTDTYDGFGRLASANNNLSGTALTLSFQWDADGNRIRVTQPDGVYFTFDYDGLDRQTIVKENGATPVATVTYDNQGRRSGDTRSGVASTYGYDAVSRLASLADDLAGTADDVTTTLGYNPASQITSKTRSNSGYAFTGYVSVSRSYAVNGLNQYSTGGAATFTYDPNGNLTGDGTSSYTYDVENRLISRSGGLTIVYDPSGRLWQTSGGASGTTRYLYDGDELSVEYDGAGNVLRRYVHGPGMDDPILWYEGASLSDRRSLQIDSQGSIVSIANASGARIAIDSYDEYGIPGAGNIGRFQYTGQAWLPDLGMYYYKARIYSPSLGRFMQTDPIGYADQNNLYAYVGNDPTDRSDPTGLEAVAGAAQFGVCTGSISCTGSYSPGSIGIGTTGPSSSSLANSGDDKRKSNGSDIYVRDGNGQHKSNKILTVAECSLPGHSCSATVAGTPDGKVLYRAGTFYVRTRDIELDPTTGNVLGTKGVSVDTSPANMARKGLRGPYNTFAVPPDGIGIRWTGGTHYELVPKYPMSKKQFVSLIESLNSSLRPK